MSAVKERIIGAVSIMSDGDAEIIWNMILNQFSSSWDSIQETEPDGIDLQMLADIENDPDCHEFIPASEFLDMEQMGLK